MELGGQTRDARGLEQRRCRFHVTRALGHGRIEVRIEAEDDVVVGDLATALEQLLDQRVAVDRECDGLTNPLISELARVGAEPDLAMVGGLGFRDREVRVVEQRRTGEHVELDDGVDLSALIGRDHRAGLVEERELDGVERRAAPPPRLVAAELGAGRDVVAVELPRAGPIRHRVERRAGLIRHRRDGGLRVEQRYELGQVAVRPDERHLDRQRIDCLGRILIDDALQARVARCDEATHRGDDVVGGEVPAALPLHALAKLERPDRVVRVRLPPLGETWADVPGRRVEGHQELHGLGDEPVAAEVVHVQVDRPGRDAGSRPGVLPPPAPAVAGGADASAEPDGAAAEPDGAAGLHAAMTADSRPSTTRPPRRAS